jgi:hypothetical protein
VGSRQRRRQAAFLWPPPRQFLAGWSSWRGGKNDYARQRGRGGGTTKGAPKGGKGGAGGRAGRGKGKGTPSTPRVDFKVDAESEYAAQLGPHPIGRSPDLFPARWGCNLALSGLGAAQGTQALGRDLRLRKNLRQHAGLPGRGPNGLRRGTVVSVQPQHPDAARPEEAALRPPGPPTLFREGIPAAHAPR